MNYGFAIDNRKCIGCHACSTACKSENEVPLGVDRTWVKYTERGRYPDVTRGFQVTRCNHCERPPCVTICPVTAMYKRPDGIVEFDSDACIGCKACMQACPYDAIHIDPETHTAAKCHFCAHRVEIGLEPACVVVCPEHAIVAGDLDDPTSEISRLVSGQPTTVRKPEQGTYPKVLYIEGDRVSLRPEGGQSPGGFMFADATSEQLAATHAPLQIAGPSGSSRVAGQMVQVGWNAQHQIPWHWPVPAYLVTKAVGAGVFGLMAVGAGAGVFEVTAGDVAAGGLLGLLATLATTALLVFDLERPERFLSILTRPQWKSWLTRGAFLLIGFSAVSTLWWLAGSLAWLFGGELPGLLQVPLAWLTAPLAAGAAAYTAFLFAQAEGRDLWQSPLLPLHLLVQAAAMGGAGLSLLAGFDLLSPGLAAAARWTFFGALAVDLLVTLGGEFAVPHASDVAARAARAITHGRYRRHFWWGGIGLGHALPMALLLTGVPALGAAAALFAAVGLYLYEYAFVMAPQEIPNS